MTIETGALVPLIRDIIFIAPGLRGKKRKYDIGEMRFGNNKARLELKLSAGKPKANLDNYLHDIIEIESMKIFIYMPPHGKWRKRIRTGLIVYADLFIDFPECKFCGARATNDHYSLKDGMFGNKDKYKVCNTHGKKVRRLSEQEIVKEASIRITNLISKSLGLS
jgi:hypothetical protein